MCPVFLLQTLCSAQFYNISTDWHKCHCQFKSKNLGAKMLSAKGPIAKIQNTRILVEWGCGRGTALQVVTCTVVLIEKILIYLCLAQFYVISTNWHKYNVTVILTLKI